MTFNIDNFLKQTKVALIGAIAVPPRNEYQEDWQKDIENNEVDLSTAIILPVILLKQYLQCSIAEKEELQLESAILDKLQCVNVNDSYIVVDGLFRIELNRIQQEIFSPLWYKQKLLCFEYRIYINFDSNLFISIGGLWDGQSNSWMFEPHSRFSEFWNVKKVSIAKNIGDENVN